MTAIGIGLILAGCILGWLLDVRNQARRKHEGHAHKR